MRSSLRSQTKPAVLNPLRPNSDQHQSSPHNIHSLSRDEIMRNNKMITKEKSLDLLLNYLHKMSFKAVVLCSRAGTAEKCRRKVRCTYGTERFLFVFFFPYLTYSFVWSSRMPSEKICVQTKPSVLSITAIFPWPWKMVSVSVRYLFYQPVDGKIKAWTLRFLAKEKPNMEEALVDWPIVLQYDVKAKYRLISRKFSGI